MKDVPIIPIYFYTKVFLQKTDIKGWPYNNVEQVWYAKDLYKISRVKAASADTKPRAMARGFSHSLAPVWN